MTTSSGGTALQSDSGNVYIAMANTWANVHSASNYGAIANTWTHIAITLNYQTFVSRVYCNGALLSTLTGNGAPSAANLFVIGKSGDGTISSTSGARAYLGYIRQFAVYSSVLNASEILSVAQATDAQSCLKGTYYQVGSSLATSSCLPCLIGFVRQCLNIILPLFIGLVDCDCYLFYIALFLFVQQFLPL
jgi:hypothetical protein